jgi:hypothetical protein
MAPKLRHILGEAVYYSLRLRKVKMKSVLLKGIRIVAGIVIVWSTLANFFQLSMIFGGLLPREANEVEIYERLFVPIRFALFREGYEDRNLGYVSERSVMGKPRDPQDDVRWSQLRYVTIPFILVSDPQGPRYVIGDYTGRNPVVPPPLDGFVKISDEGSGLVLYKKVVP